jgi:hypothetical protein
MSLPKYKNPPPVPAKKQLTKDELRDAIQFSYAEMVRKSAEIRQIEQHIEKLKEELWARS